MKGLEFYSMVTIGRYKSGSSILHRLSPFTKYLWLLAIILSASISSSNLVLISTSLISIAGIKIGKLSIKHFLKSFYKIWPFLLFIASVQILITWPNDNSAVLLHIYKLSFTQNEAIQIAVMILRFFSIVISISVFTAVTTESDCARGVETLLHPLKWIGINVKSLALIFSLSFKFVPILAWELETIIKAQAARGADFGTSTKNPIKKILAWLPLLVPVSIRALERGEALAEAMESRLYGYGPSSSYITNKMTKADVLAIILAMAYITGLCLIYIF